ncbi:MAG TPA: sugar phosphate isomerase/epimerase family protein [Anaerolineae bacterium]|nr:sugar phosphate isomerase/epimerase family protein [Anaerolineae bacterium]
MRYGVCNWIFGDEDLAATAAFLAQAGFDGLELKGDLQLYRPADVVDVLGEHGLAVLSLTPEDVDLAHPESRVREEALDYYLHLLDFAAAVGAPVVSCHGAVGRVRALAAIEEEYAYLLAGVQRIAARAVELNLRLAMEVLNRYESHLLNTAAQAVQFVADVADVADVSTPNVGILLDAYHMNIEEADPAAAILDAGEHLFLFHAADSNRQAVGRGHTDFLALMGALRRVGYAGDIVIECTAAGPDPFTPVKGPGWRDQVRRYAAESLPTLKTLRVSEDP